MNTNYPEILRINGISFCQVSQKPESHLWEITYLSEPLREIKDDYAIFAHLYAGRRGTERAWTARLFCGGHCLFVDRLEHDNAKDAIERVIARLEGVDGIDVDETEHARELLEAQRHDEA
jgi:hypothetical protein